MPGRITLDTIANDIGYIKEDIKDIKDTVGSTYVTKDQFEPIRNIVYGLVGLILTAVVVAILAIVVGAK